MKVPLSEPDITDLEIEYVTRVMRTRRLSLGPRLREFEEKFAAYVETRFAVATNSGTSALHLCVRALGIGASDEVVTTSFSFVASANCLLYERALPIFVDIDPVTLNIDPEKIRRFLKESCTQDAQTGLTVDKQTGRTVKAILPVHVFGLPCGMGPLLEIARTYHLDIIEDACEALGAEYRARRVGTFGRAAVFAFYPNKQMTTAEGGMIVTNDEQLARLCRSMRNQGRDEDSSWLQHVRLGYNYRLSELHCALGLAQLERIDELLRAREKVAQIYETKLAGNPMITLPHTPPGRKRSWFVYVVKINDSSSVRDGVIACLRENGIGCQAYFPAIHQQPYFNSGDLKCVGPLPRTEQAADCCLALPFSPRITREQIEFVCNTLQKAVKEKSTKRFLIYASPKTKLSSKPVGSRKRALVG
jgi:dTDP-4-amino-4,6-dideoxygalactose transaminase